jgi:predicted HTH transcriptional regulator
MTSILIFIAGIALGFYIKGKTIKSTGGAFALKSSDEMDDMRAEAHEALAERTENRKQKILELMKGEAVHDEELKACGVARHPSTGSGQVTCNDVEKLLDVSDQTASKYLNELEGEQKIEQIGTSGRGVYYVLK